jgi:hypothetical protein
LKYGGTMITCLEFNYRGDQLYSTALNCSVTGWDMKELKLIEQFESIFYLRTKNFRRTPWLCDICALLPTAGDSFDWRK